MKQAPGPGRVGVFVLALLLACAGPLGPARATDHAGGEPHAGPWEEPEQEAAVEPGAEAEAVEEAPPTASVRLRVVAAAADDPVSGAKVYFMWGEDFSEHEVQAMTNQAGEAHSGSLPQGERVKIQVVKPGWEPGGVVRAFDLSETELVIELERELEPAGD